MEKDKLQRLRFLIAEDDPFQREGLALLLSHIGARHILQAENGRVALQLLQQPGDPVDILLCDIDMPEMDGMALLRHLKSLEHQPSIILVSQWNTAMRDSVAAMAEAYELDILGTMPKPPSRSTLLDLLAQHAPGKRKRGLVPAVGITRQELADALESGAIVPWFQPKVEMASGRVVGVEALVRWNSPSRGLLAPGAFLGAVETHGLMDSLTWVVLAQSAAIGRRWQEQGLPLQVSVNLSLSSLGRPELAERVFEVVSQRGLAPSSLILEVTETAAMSAVGPSLENLTRLRLRGFGLSIDDYGTGYSSLQQLARVPFTELKIDQSFVKAATQHETTRIIVESSLDIARRLHLKTTAEGVETQAHWQLLRALGCDIAQGYLIARPMPAEAIADWVARWKCPAFQSATQAAQRVDILLVEDQAFQRETYAELLGKLQLGRVDTAADAATALQRLATCAYGLVITDIDLGSSSGLELVRLIRCRKTEASPHTRIVLLSAHTEQELVLKSIALDINGFLGKPARSHALREVIGQALHEDFRAQAPEHYLERPEAAADLTGAPAVPAVSAAIVLGADKVAASASRLGRQGPGGHRLKLAALQPGMVLAQPLLAQDKTLILRSGHVLTQAIINRLLDLRERLDGSLVWVLPFEPGQAGPD